MAKIVAHPEKLRIDMLSTFERSKELSHILDAFEMTVRHRMAVQPVMNSWEANRNAVVSRDPILDFSSLLAKLNLDGLSYSPRRKHPEQRGETSIPGDDTATGHSNDCANEKIDSPDSADATVKPKYTFSEGDLVRADEENCRIGETRSSKAKESNNPYYFFTPAWELQDLLVQFFPDKNPGEVIGQYLRALFPLEYEYEPDTEAHYYPLSKKLTIDTPQQRDFLTSVCGWLEKDSGNIFYDAIKFLLGLPCDQRLWDPNCFFPILVSAPQPLFMAMMGEWNQTQTPYIESPAQMLHLLRLPLGSNEVAILNGAGTLAIDHIAALEEIADQLVSIPVEQRPYAPVPLLFEAMYGGLMDVIFNVQGDFDREWELILAQYTSYRRSMLRDRSPLKPYDAAWLHYVISQYEDWMGPLDAPEELTLCLAQLWPASDTGNRSPLGLWDTDGKPFPAQIRTQEYIKLFRAAHADDLPELASAFLAFFIFSHCMINRDGLRTWTDRFDVIKKAITLPGGEMVVLAVSVLARAAEDSGDQIEALRLRSMLQTPVHISNYDIRTVNTLRAPDKTLIEDDLRAELGVERWNKLNNDSRTNLVDAEMKWSMMHRELGKGVENWGSSALDLIKPIERELATRLKGLFDSEVVARFIETEGLRMESRATLGSLLAFIKKCSDGPLDIQEFMDNTGMTIHKKPELIQRLIKAKDSRNKAAHPSKFSSVDYVKLRTLIFQGGLLSDFVDSL